MNKKSILVILLTCALSMPSCGPQHESSQGLSIQDQHFLLRTREGEFEICTIPGESCIKLFKAGIDTTDFLTSADVGQRASDVLKAVLAFYGLLLAGGYIALKPKAISSWSLPGLIEGHKNLFLRPGRLTEIENGMTGVWYRIHGATNTSNHAQVVKEVDALAPIMQDLLATPTRNLRTAEIPVSNILQAWAHRLSISIRKLDQQQTLDQFDVYLKENPNLDDILVFAKDLEQGLMNRFPNPDHEDTPEAVRQIWHGLQGFMEPAKGHELSTYDRLSKLKSDLGRDWAQRDFLKKLELSHSIKDRLKLLKIKLTFHQLLPEYELLTIDMPKSTKRILGKLKNKYKVTNIDELDEFHPISYFSQVYNTLEMFLTKRQIEVITNELAPVITNSSKSHKELFKDLSSMQSSNMVKSYLLLAGGLYASSQILRLGIAAVQQQKNLPDSDAIAESIESKARLASLGPKVQATADNLDKILEGKPYQTDDIVPFLVLLKRLGYPLNPEVRKLFRI